MFNTNINNRKKRIKFDDFWTGYDPRKNYFTDLLTKYNDNFTVVDSQPDIIIFSVFGLEHRNSVYNNCKKVFYTGENAHNDKLRTYAHLNLTFEPTSIHNNNIRLPLWILYGYEKDMMLTEKRTDKFCCFVQSKSINYRNNFCKKLSNYKRVDCGGGCLNNVGG